MAERLSDIRAGPSRTWRRLWRRTTSRAVRCAHNCFTCGRRCPLSWNEGAEAEVYIYSEESAQ